MSVARQKTQNLTYNRDKALRKARRSKDENDWKVYKTLRNHCNNLLRYAKSKYNKDLLNKNRYSPRRFWKAIKNIFPTKHTTNTTFSKHNNETRVSRFSEHFAKIITNLERKIYSML